MRHPRLGRAWGGAWRLALAAAAGLPIVSIVIGRGASAPTAIVGLLFALAALRPAEAWLLAAALAPLGAWIGGSIGFGPSLTEPIVLAFLSGWLVHTAAHAAAGGATGEEPPRDDRTVRALLLLLGLTVLASLLVRLAAHHLTVDFPALYVRRLFRFLWHDYFGGPSRFRAPLVPGVRLLAGIALAAASLSLVRRDSRLALRGAGVLAVSAGLAALVSLAPLAASAVSAGWNTAFPKGLAALRLSSVGPDVNAAGSFYVLALGAAGGLAFAVRRFRPLWGMVAASILAGLWMTGSRAALAAPVLVAVLAAAHFGAPRRGRTRAVAAVTAAGFLVLLGGYLYATARVRTPAGVALDWRVEHGTRALRMFADHPLFGAGVGRFYGLSRGYASPGWPRPGNSHNNFLQLLAELGLLGLVLVASLVGIVLWRAWRAAAAARSGPLLACVAGGVLAFVVTWLAGHPLLVFEVAVPFWFTLGLVAGLTPGLNRTPARWRRLVTPVVAIAVALSVFPRAQAEMRGGDLSRAAIGFSSVHADARGQRFRWMARRAQLFVAAGTREVAIPFRSPHVPAAVKIFVNGRCVARLVAGRRWTEAMFEVPPTEGRRFVRVELTTALLAPVDEAGHRVVPGDGRVQVGLPRMLR